MKNSDSPNDIVIARGTEEGLVLRVDGRNTKKKLLASLRSFLSSRKRFLSGSRSVVLEWLVEDPPHEVVMEIGEVIQAEFGLELRESSGRQARSQESENMAATGTGSPVAHSNQRQKDVPNSGEEITPPRKEAAVVSALDALDDHTELLQSDRPPEGSKKKAKAGSVDENWGDRLFQGIRTLQQMEEFPVEKLQSLTSSKTLSNNFITQATMAEDARVLFQTLRSGQRVESANSVIIVGDVNSGAEVVSGGDVIVLGILRGVAHAGAYHEGGQGRFIFALDLKPTQLRIGGIISRGESASSHEGGAEFAKAEGDMIVVQQYTARDCSQLIAARSILQDAAV